MKETYPVRIRKGEKYFVVHVPDFDCNTQGETLTDAIEMARDVIGLMGTTLEDEGTALPVPSEISTLQAGSNEILTLVDVDFTEYRRKNEVRSVKKNCTLPGWLCYEAEKANINFSAVLQAALKKELKLQ